MSKQVGYRYKETINESQESESIKAARKLYMQRRGVDETEADRWVRIDLRGDIPALRSKQGGKFIFGVTRMFLDGEIRNAETIEGINTAVQYASTDAHIKEYDRNLNGLSAQEFINKFADAVKADSQADRNARAQEQYIGESDYQIVPINSFEEAQQYSKYTSWCITHYENMYESYSSNGIAQFYFCLKKGFENVRMSAGENCPLDEYGLSMIAVCVDKDGRLKTCTCRWNHDKGGNDHVMGTKQISQVINRNFYEVFKPNDKWAMAFQKIKADLKAGKELHQIFDFVSSPSYGITAVRFGKQWNYINENRELITDTWFDSGTDFYNGFAKVKLDNKWNVINTEGQLISNQWFDYISDVYDEFDVFFDFVDGFAKVKLDNKENLINTEGQLISNQWFDYISDVYNGFAKVILGGKENVINTEGRMFDNVSDFYNGFAKVKLSGKYNFVNTEGQLISNQWFDKMYDDFDNGFAIVGLDNKWNVINTEGQLISNQWFDKIKDAFDKSIPTTNENRTIIISERQAELLKEHILNEGLSQIVYHFTSLEALYEIILSGKFYLKTGVFRNTSDLGGGKRMFYFSTTRNKNAKEGYSNRYNNETGVRITLDGEKLAQKYHGKSYNYWGDGALGRMQYLNPEKVSMHKRWSDEMKSHRNDETEDRIWSYNAIIPDIWDYILRIDICLPEMGKLADYESRIAKAESEGKEALVKSFTSALQQRKQFEKRCQEVIYDIYTLIGRKNILFLYDNVNDFAAGNKNFITPQWLENNDYYEGYKERQALHSVNKNVYTNNAVINTLSYALSVMIFKEPRQNRQKKVVEYCKKYGFTEFLNGQLIKKIDDNLWRYSNIFELAKEIDNNLRIDKESSAKIQNMVSHWMRNNGYYTIGDIVKEGKEIKKVRQGMIAYEEHEPDYEIGFEGPDASDYAHVISEDVNPEDVDLSSFEIKKKLNPKFWKDNKLDSRVRLKLLDIADDFTDFLNVNWVKPSDITMTGSLANYTWNEEYSDIDLHIILNYKDVDERTDFVKHYFDAKKKEWNEKHKDIKIYGFPVEVYVQNENEPHKSSGVYSLEKNEWVTEPDVNNFSEDDYDKNNVKTKVADFMNKIDGLENDFNTTDDEHQIEIIFDDAESLFNDIKDERKNAFKETDKELSDGNIVFKTLRRNGYIEKISDLKNKTYDKINSLD